MVFHLNHDAIGQSFPRSLTGTQSRVASGAVATLGTDSSALEPKPNSSLIHYRFGSRLLSVLFCSVFGRFRRSFFVIAHGRRRILHCNVTKHPTSAWVAQQLREAFPFDSAPKFLIFDRGSNFNEEVIDAIGSFGIKPKRTSFQSP